MLRSANKSPISALCLGLMIVFTLIASACDSSATVKLPGIETTSPDDILPNESFQLQTPLVLDNIRFEHISVEDGLSQNSGLAILQDSNGFMWFGTQDGLNKYDGQNFTVYKHDPDNSNSLSDNWILAIHEDHLGALWIGTLNGGLDRYDRELDQFSHYQHDPDNTQSLSHNEVLAIHEDPDGVLWIGTRRGLDRFVSETESFTHYQHNPDDAQSLSADAVQSIHKTRDGILWVGTEGGGLNRFNLETQTFTHFSNDPDDPQSLSDDNVWVIYEDTFEALWLGTNGGLDRFDKESGTFAHFINNPYDPQGLSHNSVRAIYKDPLGALWIGTDGGGLDRFDRETETFTNYQNDPSDPHSLSHYAVYEIYQDREGVLWIGTNGGGLNKLFLGGLNFAYFNFNPNDPNSLSNNDIRGIYEDQSGTLWVGTNGGLNKLNRRTGQWLHYQHDPDDPFSLSSNVIGDVYEDQEGLLWIGTYDNGLNSFDPETERFTRYQDDPNDPTSFKGSTVTEIYQDQKGILWIGTLEGGLNRYDQERGSFTHYQTDPNDPDSINSNSVYSIYEDQQGWLWIGTFGDGLNKFDRENEIFTLYQTDSKDPRSLSNNLVLVIFQDREGTLWIGTAGGLNKFDSQTETFTHYRENEGLPNDLVVGILEDEQGNLWLSTNHGLSRFNPKTETFKNFDVTNGIQSNEFNGLACHKSNSGEMFFGGIRGLNAFFPDRIQENNPYIPPIALTRLTQGGEDIDLGHTLNHVTEFTLNWPDNYFEFEFAALSFAQPGNNQYAYILEGFDEKWNEIGTRNYGKYTNLPGGTYTLRLRGSNNDGIWNEEGAAMLVTIVPPFWSTWWFRGGMLLALMGIAIVGYRLRVMSLEARGRELETQVVSRTRELAALNAVASVVSRSLDLERVLTNSLDKTLEVMEMEAGGIYLLHEDAQTLTIAAYKGLSAPFVAEIDNLKVGEGFSGQVAQTGEPLVVQDLSTDARLTRSAVKESDFQSLAIAPLVSRAKVLGTLFVITRRDREFSQQDIELLISIGGQIGVAVENAQLYEQAKQIAVVEERQRLARELHDSVTQSLHSSTLLAEAGQRLASRGDLERTRGYLTRLGEISQQALKEMRLLVYELRPLHLMNVGLVWALQQRLDAVERRAGVDVNLVVDGEIELPLDVEEALFRIAQEALNNALKHAAPTSIVVTIHIDGESPYQRVELDVVDDGQGFDPAALGDEGGLGLVSMRQRVENVGGVLDVRSTPGEGTHVRASVDMGASTGSPETREVDA